MQSTILHASPYRSSILRLVAVLGAISLILLTLSLWFGPVSLPYLAASVIVGFLFSFLLLRYWQHQAEKQGRRLWFLAILVIAMGPVFLRRLFFQSWGTDYAVWLAIQPLAIVLIVLAIVLAVEERIVTFWTGAAVAIVLFGIGSEAWYRVEQSRPLMYQTASHVFVVNNTHPDAQEISFTTPADAPDILAFYRTHLEQSGWQFTCSMKQLDCESKITGGANQAHDVYHRNTDTTLQGPTYEILIRDAGAKGEKVEIYDFTRGVPNQLTFP